MTRRESICAVIAAIVVALLALAIFDNKSAKDTALKKYEQDCVVNGVHVSITGKRTVKSYLCKDGITYHLKP